MTTRIVYIGAGSAIFLYKIFHDIVNIEALHGVNMVLHDIDEKRLGISAGFAERINKEAGAELELEHTLDRKEALNGADFVLVSIEVDRYNRWRLDWEIPFKHGIKQVIGENGGPGGLFHTLRNIPPIMEIAYDMEDLCPNAIMLNYTNPVPQLCLAISRYTKVNVVGLCHEVRHQLERLGPMMNIPVASFDPVSVGLNHFSWFKELKLKDGTNVYPVLDEALSKANGFQPLCRVMYEKFGLFPSTDDNHLGEYLPYAWDVCPPNGRGFAWIDWCENEGNNRWQRVNRIIKGIEPLEVKGKLSDEVAMPIIAGVVSDSNHIEYQVNLQNKGQIPNLIKDAIIETPAVINKNGVNPVHVGDMPDGLAALCNREILIHSLSAEAGVHRDIKLAQQAMMVDPVVQDIEAAEKAFSELMDAHMDLLPQFK